jgi:hypothetical protein
MAERRRNDPPKIDAKGVQAFDRLLTFLGQQGVEVILAHPPFNPIYHEHVKGGTYTAGLARIEQLTRDLAAVHGLRIIGSFDPAKVGCTADMYIDAEHGGPECLGKIFAQYEAREPPPRPKTAGEQE